MVLCRFHNIYKKSSQKDDWIFALIGVSAGAGIFFAITGTVYMVNPGGFAIDRLCENIKVCAMIISTGLEIF